MELNKFKRNLRGLIYTTREQHGYYNVALVTYVSEEYEPGKIMNDENTKILVTETLVLEVDNHEIEVISRKTERLYKDEYTNNYCLSDDYIDYHNIAEYFSNHFHGLKYYICNK